MNKYVVAIVLFLQRDAALTWERHQRRMVKIKPLFLVLGLSVSNFICIVRKDWPMNILVLIIWPLVCLILPYVPEHSWRYVDFSFWEKIWESLKVAAIVPGCMAVIMYFVCLSAASQGEDMRITLRNWRP